MVRTQLAQSKFRLLSAKKSTLVFILIFSVFILYLSGAKKGDAIKGDAIKGDAIKGDAIKGDAIKGDANNSFADIDSLWGVAPYVKQAIWLAEHLPANLDFRAGQRSTGRNMKFGNALQFSLVSLEMRRRQNSSTFQDPNMFQEVPASSPSCKSPLHLPRPYNILEPRNNQLQHHGIYSCVMSKKYALRPGFVLDIGGLYVPVEYDCRNMMPDAHVWGSYDFFTPIPDRWTRCLDHQLLEAENKAGTLYHPLLPVIDEEYLERAMVYQMVLAADAHKQKEFVVADLGARWGTWSLRAIAALRSYNPMPYKVYLVETNPVHCKGARNVIDTNNIANVTLHCNYFDAVHFKEFAASVEAIDLIDLDCDGCERKVLPSLSSILAAKVRRVIVACHWRGCNDQATDWFQSVFPSDQWRVVDSADQSNGCIAHIHAGELHAAAKCVPRVNPRPSIGLVHNGDGAIVVDNIKLTTPVGYPLY